VKFIICVSEVCLSLVKYKVSTVFIHILHETSYENFLRKLNSKTILEPEQPAKVRCVVRHFLTIRATSRLEFDQFDDIN
jgi:hypothetical protein